MDRVLDVKMFLYMERTLRIRNSVGNNYSDYAIRKATVPFTKQESISQHF